MSISTRVQAVMRGLFGVTWGTSGAETWDAARNFTLGLPMGEDSTVPQPYATVSSIALGIGTVAADAASIDWELFRKGAEKPLAKHPLLDLLARPAPEMVGWQLWVATYVYRKLFGEAFWYYPELRLGAPGSLKATSENRGAIVLLDPRIVGAKLKDGKIAWTIQAPQGEETLDSERLTQFKRFNPYNPLRGLSEIASVLIEMEGDYSAARYNRNYFSAQNGVPTGLIIPPENTLVRPEDKGPFLRQWNEQHGGGRRHVGMLPGGWAWQSIAESAKEMDFKALREYARELMLGVQGLPPFLAGVLDKANYANAREQKDVYYHGTLTRFLREIQASLNGSFLPKIGLADFELYPKWEAVKALTENLNEKADIAGKLFALGFTKRQINDRLELGFDVDQLEDADVGYLPFSVTPVAFLNEPPEPAPVVAPEAGQPEEGDEDEDEPKKGFRHRASTWSEARRAMVWRTTVAQVRDLEARFGKMIRGHFEKIRGEAKENLNGVRGWLAVQKADTDFGAFDLESALAELQAKSAPIHAAALRRGGEAVLREAGVGIAFDPVDPRVLAKLSELTSKITRVDETLERSLRESLAEGLLAGESPQELAKRIDQVIDAGMSRSMTIARTETGSAFSAGRHEGMKQSGVKRHEWLSARDDRVREDHVAEDGQVVSIGEPFPNTGLLYPNDSSGPAEQIINCRCVAIPVIEEDDNG